MNPFAWRKQQSLSLREVAAQIGVSSAMSVLRYESGAREVPNSIALAYERISKRTVTAEDLDKVRTEYLSRAATKAA